MTTLARWCFRHKFRVLAVWVAALFVLGGLSASAGYGLHGLVHAAGDRVDDAL